MISISMAPDLSADFQAVIDEIAAKAGETQAAVVADGDVTQAQLDAITTVNGQLDTNVQAINSHTDAALAANSVCEIDGVREFYFAGDKLTLANGEIYLKSGAVDTDVASYPDARQNLVVNGDYVSGAVAATAPTGASYRVEDNRIYLYLTSTTFYGFDADTLNLVDTRTFSQAATSVVDGCCDFANHFILSSTGFVTKYSITGVYVGISADFGAGACIAQDGTYLWVYDSSVQGWHKLDKDLNILGVTVMRDPNLNVTPTSISTANGFMYLHQGFSTYECDLATGLFTGRTFTSSINIVACHFNGSKYWAVNSSRQLYSEDIANVVGCPTADTSDAMNNKIRKFVRVK